MNRLTQTAGAALRPSAPIPHAPFLERAAAHARRGHETAARLALGAYLVGRLVNRALAATGNDAERELARQAGATRRRILKLPGRTAERAHLLAIVESLFSEGRDRAPLRDRLLEYAEHLERSGQLDEALSVVGVAARVAAQHMSPAQAAALALFAGRLNRLLARWDEAGACYRAAEEAGHRAGDPVPVLRGRLGQGAVLRGRGNLPAARAIAEAVEVEAAAAGLPTVQAMANADLAAVLRQQGFLAPALECSYRAFRLFSDPTQRLRALGDVGIGLMEIGAFDVARIAFELVAASGSKSVVRVNALVELMELESAVGDRAAFERRRAAAAAARSRMPPSTAVDFHFRVGIGLARFGDPDAGRRALSSALRLAEGHGLHAWYFRIERALSDLATGTARAVSAERAQRPDTALVVRQLKVGLRRDAARAAV